MDPAPAPVLPFEVIETAGGWLYRLPRRGFLGSAAAGRGLAPLFVAGLACLMLFNGTMIRLGRGPIAEWEWVVIVLTMLGTARLVVLMVSIAAVIWCGRPEVEVWHDGTVRGLDRAGWFRVRWTRFKPDTARKLILQEFAPAKTPDGRPNRKRVLWHLRAELDSGWKAWLVPCHAREVLAPLAELLATHVTAAPVDPAEAAEPTAAAPAVAPVAAPLPVVVEAYEPPSRDVPEQPPGSRVVLERHPDGVTVTVPPLGLVGANGGLVGMGLLFVLIGTVITGVALAPMFQANPQRPRRRIDLHLGIIFFCIGEPVCDHVDQHRAGAGGARGRRRPGCSRSRRAACSAPAAASSPAANDLLDIAAGPSNVAVNNKPLPATPTRLAGQGQGRDDDRARRDRAEVARDRAPAGSRPAGDPRKTARGSRRRPRRAHSGLNSHAYPCPPPEPRVVLRSAQRPARRGVVRSPRGAGSRTAAPRTSGSLCSSAAGSSAHHPARNRFRRRTAFERPIPGRESPTPASRSPTGACGRRGRRLPRPRPARSRRPRGRPSPRSARTPPVRGRRTSSTREVPPTTRQLWSESQQAARVAHACSRNAPDAPVGDREHDEVGATTATRVASGKLPPTA